MPTDSDRPAYSGTRTTFSPAAKRVAAKWSFIGMGAMVAISTLTFAIVQREMVAVVTAVPWQFSGLTFVALTAAIGAPAIVVGLGCLLYGIRRAAHVEAQRDAR